MSLQYHPDFVAEKVVLLESDLRKVGERFITGTSDMLNLRSHLSDRSAQLALLHERIASLSSLPSSVKTFPQTGIMLDGGLVTTSPLVSAVISSFLLNLLTFAILFYQVQIKNRSILLKL